ncbi:putative cyclic diguanylate phosphodiesterase (EAL) domain protein [Salmonella enterica subsp. enterica serovar Enteritidis str. CDC_2010K_1441]|uniref:EAL domain-containing protein n=1 Tax=Salmonella enterica TaxID=28901 RepID=UPI0002A6BAB9|nr:EAL domain-containing protein [Salmonella enterica]ELL88354.1 putative cyclic diguanylate phosphodiesterase (EAL) domain protein [Salmonella enterica subsp. enterica serovar Enteritidis str. CDC_2010K_1441]
MHFSAFRLQQAIRNREFTPFYQPIVCATGGEVVGCEMLARWLHPQKGLLSAGNFIPAIEATGLGGALLRGLADEVCGDGQDLARSAGRRLMMTLNLSLSLVMTPLFRPHLLALSIRLEQAGMTPVFEITEREDIRAFPQAAVFRQLAAGGLRFAVDDFGTGHAGPASTVADRMIARTVSLARCQGARVIAEGIETPAQAARLRDAGGRLPAGLALRRPDALRAVSFPADAKKPAGLWLSYAHRSHFYEPAVVIPDRCRQAEQP